MNRSRLWTLPLLLPGYKTPTPTLRHHSSNNRERGERDRRGRGVAVYVLAMERDDFSCFPSRSQCGEEWRGEQRRHLEKRWRQGEGSTEEQQGGITILTVEGT